jgi:hypothetical protein
MESRETPEEEIRVNLRERHNAIDLNRLKPMAAIRVLKNLTFTKSSTVART